MSKKEVEKNSKELIPLSEAEKYCEYSADYLKLRARQEKLKARKVGRAWHTKKSWVEEYEEKMEEYWDLREDGIPSSKASSLVFEKEEAKEVKVIYRPKKAEETEEKKEKKEVKETAPQFVFSPRFKKAAALGLVLLLFLSAGAFVPKKELMGQAVELVGSRFGSPRLGTPLSSLGESFSFKGAPSFQSGFKLDGFSLSGFKLDGFSLFAKNIKENVRQATGTLTWYTRYEARIFSSFGRWLGRSVKSASLLAWSKAGQEPFISKNSLTGIFDKEIRFSKNFYSPSETPFEESPSFFNSLTAELSFSFSSLSRRLAGGFDEAGNGAAFLLTSVKKTGGNLLFGLGRVFGKTGEMIGKRTSNGWAVFVKGTKNIRKGAGTLFAFWGGSFSRFGRGLAATFGSVTKSFNLAAKISRGTFKEFLAYLKNTAKTFAGGLKNFLVKLSPKNLFAGRKESPSRKEEEKEKKEQEEREVRVSKEGVVVLPSSMREKGVKEKIKNAFSDEVVVTSEDERSGIVKPVFKEGTGEDYMYMLVPIVEE